MFAVAESAPLSPLEAADARIDMAPHAVAPSSYQRAVYRWMYTGTGDARIEAVAGSGKTTTLIDAGYHTNGSETIYIAFGKDIQLELQARLKAQKIKASCVTTYGLGYSCVTRALGGQLHVEDNKYRTLCRDALRLPALTWAEEYERKKDAWLRSKPINERHLDWWAKQEPNPPPTLREVAAQLNEIVKFARLNLIDVRDPVQLAALIAQYDIQVSTYLRPVLADTLASVLATGEAMARDRVCDFIDMIYLPALWGLRPKTRRFALVDECQDLSIAQLDLILKLRDPEGGRLVFVGDRKQAIFSFAGANPFSWQRIGELTGAVDLPLSICYRCPRSHIRLAQQIVPQIEARPDAPEGTLRTIEHSDLWDYLVPGCAILSRRTAPLVSLCIDMIVRRIPAKILGRDVGKGLTTILESVGKMDGFDYREVRTFLRLWEERALKDIGDAEEDEGRRQNLSDKVMALHACALAFGECRTIEQLIAAVEGLFADQPGQVVLSTIHKFKGSERHTIFILEHDRLPFQFERMRAWEEEAEENLKYVAETRSTDTLYLVGAAKGGRMNAEC